MKIVKIITYSLLTFSSISYAREDYSLPSCALERSGKLNKIAIGNFLTEESYKTRDDVVKAITEFKAKGICDSKPSHPCLLERSGRFTKISIGNYLDPEDFESSNEAIDLIVNLRKANICQ